jgi:hypothetical protein
VISFTYNRVFRTNSFEVGPLWRRNLEVFGLKQTSGGRHRADVQVNALESFELRSRRSMRESESKKAARRAAKLAKKQQKLLRKAAKFDVSVESWRAGSYHTVFDSQSASAQAFG